MSTIEEMDKELAPLGKEYQKLLTERTALDEKIREIKTAIGEIIKNRDIMTLLESRDVDTTGLAIIKGKLTMKAPIPKMN